MSSGGGIEPVWHPTGKELFFRTVTTLMSATLSFDAEPAVVRRDSLFVIGTWSPSPVANYDVMPDGDHYIASRPVTQSSPLIVVNWRTELRERIAATR